MKVYHRTYTGDAVLKEGFRDRRCTYSNQQMRNGVWLSNLPLDENDRANGDTLLLVEIPESILVEYEWVEEGKRYRQFLVPARVINEYGSPEVVELG